MKPWTSPVDLRVQVQKLWDKGSLLAQMVLPQECYFPLRLPFTAPNSTDLATRFPEARLWATDLRQHAVHYRLTERTVRHREVGTQSVPEAAWVDSLEAATALIGKTKEAKQFLNLLDMTCKLQPTLRPWLVKRPLNALALVAEWPRLLAVVAWLQAHPRPGIYLRQVDIAGVDSKFIEIQRSVLAELLDIALLPEAIDRRATGASQFSRRYGFEDKPLRIRFRLFNGSAFGTDINITQAAFERLELPIKQVFITENEVNFLAFPPIPASMVVFGAGYGFEALCGAHWLHDITLRYWGDIDTHGFAILDQLRAHFPQAQSLLMDRATLMAHVALWGQERQPLLRNLTRLTTDESALFDDLRTNRLVGTSGGGVRLEQERIGFGWVQSALVALVSADLQTHVSGVA